MFEDSKCLHLVLIDMEENAELPRLAKSQKQRKKT